MYIDILRNALINGTYTLVGAQNRIDYGVARGLILPEQADALHAIALKRGITGPTETEQRLDALQNDVSEIRTAIVALGTVE